jgi:hypothetical protein
VPAPASNAAASSNEQPLIPPLPPPQQPEHLICLFDTIEVTDRNGRFNGPTSARPFTTIETVATDTPVDAAMVASVARPLFLDGTTSS